MPHASPPAAAKPAIIWFRQDLRLADHPALIAALDAPSVTPVYILDDAAGGAWAWGGAHRWWLHHSLAALQSSLAEHGAELVLRIGRAEEILPKLAHETGAALVHAAYAYEPWARSQEARVQQALAPVELQLHRGRTLFHPEAIRTKSSTPFGVYTAFMKACRAHGIENTPQPAPGKIPMTAKRPKSDRLDQLGLLPTTPDWAGGLRATWEPGEASAHATLQRFIGEHLADYKTGRNQPAEPRTSSLSPALHWGEISPLQVWHAVHQHKAAGLETYARELLWREFNIQLLWHHMELPEQPLRPQFNAMKWRRDDKAFAAWTRGRTGVPMVDAGMRQLWQTGWMHNRVRMITASFVIKHLLIDWVQGERWFWDTLVDGDLANNSANWQWVAGCGADASPFFRIFNPVLQGQKFDPAGGYVRHFVPEIAGLPDRYIHNPWEAPRTVLADAGVDLGRTYPSPIVDLNQGRARALANFAAIKGRAA